MDMESFDIVKEAYAWGARGVVVRAISDSAKEDLPINFNLTLSKRHEVSVLKVIGELAKNSAGTSSPAALRETEPERRGAVGGFPGWLRANELSGNWPDCPIA